MRDKLVMGTALIVRIAWFANRLFLLAVGVGLAASWVFTTQLGSMLTTTNPGVDVAAAIVGIRLLLLVGIMMAVATDRLLVPLAGIVASVGAGDPFVLANARRLRAVGWALLALQLLDIPCALLARFWPSLGSAAPSGDISVGGWMAVLMVFVLARVFAAGSVMRDDLAGTV